MAHTENMLKDLKKEYLVAMVLNLQKKSKKSLWKSFVNVWIIYLALMITC